MKTTGLLLLAALSGCVKAAPAGPTVTMSISVGVSENAEVATVKINGGERGKTPLDLDVVALPFDPALKPAGWPPPGATAFSPTVAQHGNTESSLALALLGDILYVQAKAGGKETLGAVRLTVTGADGRSLEFDTAEKTLASGLGKAEHSVRLWYRRGK